MKKESNKGVYIFWGIVLVIIIGIALFIFLPRNQPYLAYDSISSTIINTNEQNLENKTFGSYRNDLANLSTSSANPQKLENLDNLTKLLSSLEYANNFSLNALVYVNYNDSYKNLSGKLTQKFNEVNNYINEIQSFCNNSLKTYISSTTQNAYKTGEMMSAFLNIYKPLVASYADMHLIISKIIDKCAIKGMETNQTTINEHKKLIKEIVDMLKEENTPNTAEDCLNKAISIYGNQYYKTHFN